ncbi:MAG: hypothetical protein RIT14_2537 [Pseudomonadota bacterium]
MTAGLIVACLWLVPANLAALLPQLDQQRRAAYGLIAAGIPILGIVTWQNGPLSGMLVLAAGAAVLRWPLIGLWRGLRRVPKREPAE